MAYFFLLVYVLVLMIRPQEWIPFLQGQILGFGILDFVVAAILVTWVASIRGRKVTWKEPPQNLLMLGLFFAALMSHVRHTFLAAFIQTFVDFGKIVLLYFFIVTLVNTQKRIKGFIACVVIGTLFMAGHGILQAHWGYGFGAQLPRTIHGITRIRAFGFFNDPNDLALILVAMMPFLMTTVVSRFQNIGKRALSALALIPVLYAVYLTNSRGGWLSLGAMGVAFLYLNFSKKLAVVLAVIMFAALVARGPSRMATLSEDFGASSRERLVAWGYGNYMLKSNPIFGVGKGRFTEFSDERHVAHNSFVHTYAELGLFGYFFWLGLVFSCMKDTYVLSRLESQDRDALEIRGLARATLAGLVGFMAASFFLSRQYVLALYLFFGIAAALRVLGNQHAGKITSSFSFRRDTRKLVIAELASIPALWLFIRTMG